VQACVKKLTFLSVKIEKSTRKCALVFKKKSLLTSGLGSGRMARLVQLVLHLVIYRMQH
jgi:hypothetical protein